MHQQDRLPLSLFLLRVSIFTVMFVWTLGKFINPGNAAAVYENFYFLPGLGSGAMYVIGGLEFAVLVGFVLGFQRRLTYGAVLIFHAVSTVSAYKQYLSPYDGPNILFFAAWPMLAACVALYLLRDQDTKYSLGIG